jgi:hypothetical protein
LERQGLNIIKIVQAKYNRVSHKIGEHGKMRGKWMKPELVVIIRGKPEESILVLCKNDILGGPVQDHAPGSFLCLTNNEVCIQCDLPTAT